VGRGAGGQKQTCLTRPTHDENILSRATLHWPVLARPPLAGFEVTTEGMRGLKWRELTGASQRIYWYRTSLLERLLVTPIWRTLRSMVGGADRVVFLFPPSCPSHHIISPAPSYSLCGWGLK
jgi:hypothetical protein